jgi:putative redox protein
MGDGTLQVDVQWLEGKRIEVSARGNHLIVDQVYADGREGAGFRPTELYLSALGACTMGTVLGFCENMNIPLDGFSIKVEGKRETKPERVTEVGVRVELSGSISEETREILERVARGCRVHYTMTHPPQITLSVMVTNTNAVVAPHAPSSQELSAGGRSRRQRHFSFALRWFRLLSSMRPGRWESGRVPGRDRRAFHRIEAP